MNSPYSSDIALGKIHRSYHAITKS